MKPREIAVRVSLRCESGGCKKPRDLTHVFHQDLRSIFAPRKTGRFLISSGFPDLENHQQIWNILNISLLAAREKAVSCSKHRDLIRGWLKAQRSIWYSMFGRNYSGTFGGNGWKKLVFIRTLIGVAELALLLGDIPERVETVILWFGYCHSRVDHWRHSSLSVLSFCILLLHVFPIYPNVVCIDFLYFIMQPDVTNGCGPRHLGFCLPWIERSGFQVDLRFGKCKK